MSSRRYGSHYANTKGYLLSVGTSSHKHMFGGTSWNLVDPLSDVSEAATIFLLDLGDPRLQDLRTGNLTELPICSYLNNSRWENAQTYEISSQTHTVTFLAPQATVPSRSLDPDDCLPLPFAEKPVKLVELLASQYPTDEDAYYALCDDFLGGPHPFRVLQPLWLEREERPVCSCGTEMSFVMCIGYEGFDAENRILDDQPFFIGEAALYFFLCRSCLRMNVTSQSS